MIPMALCLPRSRPVDVSAAAMDEAVFGRLYHRTARPLRAYLMGSCGNTALADDLLQESYFRLIRADFRANDEDHRKNYLFRIATNLLRDHFRRSRPETEVEPQRDHHRVHDDEVHLRSDVGGAMAELSPRDRQMLWLAYVEGATHCEIGEVLGLRTASIRSMLFRARQRMAQQLRARGLRPSEEDR